MEIRNDESGRFCGLVTADKILPAMDRGELLGSLKGAAAWLEAASDATGKAGLCFRNALYHENGDVTWLYRHSNTAEVISAWLDLADLLGNDAYRRRAEEYAEVLIGDPVRGLYRGAETEAHGLAWYWTDAGTYTGLYAMRVPFHFYRLYQSNGDCRYLNACDLIGQTLRRQQSGSGLVCANWSPRNGWKEGSARIGSRFIYATATFATLYRITGDNAYLSAYEKGVGALLKMQNADGSFFQFYDPETAEPLGRSIKLHFYSYILNALAEAYQVMQDTRLLECATRLADHLAGIFYYRHTVPYCVGEEMEPTDRTEADSSLQDSCGGLLWLARQRAGGGVYRDMAIKLWLEAWLHQVPDQGAPGWRGALMRGMNPDLGSTLGGVPENRKHLHHDPTVIARCDLWFIVNHIFATRRLFRE